MSEVMIDEQEIESILVGLDQVIDYLKNEFVKLKNKDEDVFTRYMAYSKIRPVV